jgi:hypothetical protein
MATEISMVDVVPVTADGELPTASVVEGWTEEQLFNLIQSRNILRNDKTRTTFQEADVNGKLFLEYGHMEDYWFCRCHLPAGTSTKLALFAKEIKGMGEILTPTQCILAIVH